EICFIPDHDYAAFIDRRAVGRPEGSPPGAARGGAIVDEHGRHVGTHEGIHYFTIGQRKGLRVASPDGTPRYVLALSPANQQVVVGPKASLERTTLTASAVNWMAGTPAGPVRVAAQIRHRHHAAPGTVV